MKNFEAILLALGHSSDYEIIFVFSYLFMTQNFSKSGKEL